MSCTPFPPATGHGEASSSPLRELREGADEQREDSIAECMGLFMRLSPEGRRKAVARLLALASEQNEEESAS